MKKIIIILITLVLSYVLVGCNTSIDQTYCELNPQDSSCVVDDTTDDIVDDVETDDPVEAFCEKYPDNSICIDEDITIDDLDDPSDFLDLDWELVWNDEFDYIGLPDSDKWGYDVGGHGWGNGESQYYTYQDLDNASVDDGVLTITAIKEDFNGNAYTSARLVSKGKGDFLYGRFEVKAKLPTGVGTWPAIWMLPTNWLYGGWPTSGEIDIMEHVGYDPNIIHSTLHTDTYNHTKGTQVGESISIPTATTDFHVYAIEWEPGEIRSYVDDELYATFRFDADDIADGPSYLAWPFDEAFHFILNIAVGGAWGGVEGIDDSIFPQSMVIDYVRVYEKDYAVLDETDPVLTGEIEIVQSSSNSVAIKWPEASDDRLVLGYDVEVNDVNYEFTSVNALWITDLGLNTTYTITVKAVDFNDNKSDELMIEFETGGAPGPLEVIQMEDYTTNNGIDFETTTDSGGGLNGGWIDSGDYLEFVVDIDVSGQYVFDYRISGNNDQGSIQLSVDSDILTTTNVPYTGGWQSWQTITSSSVYLEEGIQTIRLYFPNGGFNINYFIIRG
jgi:beta-glucanase (GH16 family)